MNACEHASSATMGELLAASGLCIRSATRADCARCTGSSLGTVSFDNAKGVAHCFRCGWAASQRGLARELGLLTERILSPYERSRLRREQEALERDAIALLAAERSVYLRVRTALHRLEQIRRNAGKRLYEIQAGGKEHYRGEEELAWAALADVAARMPRAAAAYAIVSFASPDEQARFALRTSERAEMIDGVLEAGFVQNRLGHRLELLP